MKINFDLDLVLRCFLYETNSEYSSPKHLVLLENDLVLLVGTMDDLDDPHISYGEFEVIVIAQHETPAHALAAALKDFQDILNTHLENMEEHGLKLDEDKIAALDVAYETLQAKKGERND